MFVLNSADDAVEVVARPVGGEEGVRTEVAGHSIARLEIAGRGADITASGPVSVAWVVTGATDTGLGLGVPMTATNP